MSVRYPFLPLNGWGNLKKNLGTLGHELLVVLSEMLPSFT